MKSHNKKIRTQKLSRKKLTQQEYLLYEQIGVVDESQDWLELFTPARVNDLFVIMRSCSDNQLKAKQIQKELKCVGFEAIGEGTNILTMANPIYPGVVFKIALDDCGIADNYNDSVLEEMVNEKLKKPRYNHVLANHPSGIVSVQERKVPILDQDRMDEFRGSIIKTLTTLAADFLIVDLSPTDFHLNYGVERNGDWCFIDASDLYPLENLPVKIRCTRLIKYDDKAKKSIRCGGKLRYTSDFSRIFCPECKGEFIPSELRPKDKEDKKDMRNSMLDGMNQEEREQMRQEQMVRIGGKMKKIMVDVPDAPKNNLPTTDNPETVVVKNQMQVETTSQILGRFKKPDSKKNMNETKAEKEKLKTQEELVAELKETVTAPEPEEEEEEVARSGIQEPAPEAVADLEPVSENPVPTEDDPEEVDPANNQHPSQKEIDDDDDDEEEDEPHLVDAMSKGPEEEMDVPEPDIEEGPDASEEGVMDADDDDVECDIEYSIITNDESPNYGINLKFIGDAEKALDELVLPLFIWIGDNDYAQAISREQMKNLIRPVLMDMIEDQR